VEEALALRAAGVKQHICLLEGFFEPSEIPLIAENQLSPVIHHEGQLRAMEKAALKKPIDVWLKVDTGMHRLGFPPQTVPAVLAGLTACANVRQVRLLSHFANADDKSNSMTTAQTERFMGLAVTSGSERSLANSAGVIAWPMSHLEWVRPGIMLYGVAPLIGYSADQLDLKPVMTLQSAVIAVQRLHKGDPVGYGGDWTCPEDMPVGVIAIGYGDGYSRHSRAGTPVLVKGKPVPLIGRVSMDMISVDLRTQPHIQVGDPAVLWGDGLPVAEVASHAGTIGYTLLCGVTPRVPRVEAIPQGAGIGIARG
jgi:alanine racemase